MIMTHDDTWYNSERKIKSILIIYTMDAIDAKLCTYSQWPVCVCKERKTWICSRCIEESRGGEFEVDCCKLWSHIYVVCRWLDWTSSVSIVSRHTIGLYDLMSYVDSSETHCSIRCTLNLINYFRTWIYFIVLFCLLSCLVPHVTIFAVHLCVAT